MEAGLGPAQENTTGHWCSFAPVLPQLGHVWWGWGVVQKPTGWHVPRQVSLDSPGKVARDPPAPEAWDREA